MFILLVASHNYLQYELSEYTAIHLAHCSESTLHFLTTTVLNQENIYTYIYSSGLYISLPSAVQCLSRR